MRSASATAAFLAALLLLCTACTPSKHPALTGAGMDMFTPVKMRLHPLSRVALPSGGPASQPSPHVEARVELTDQFGDTGKGVGALSFELFAYETLALGHRGARLSSWSHDLSTPADNRTFWDPITRTYFFKLPLAADALDGHTRVILTAALTLPNGQRFSDELTLPVK